MESGNAELLVGMSNRNKSTYAKSMTIKLCNYSANML